MKTYTTIDAYIKDVPQKHKGYIKECRELVKSCVSVYDEVIKYGMPTIQVQGKNCIHFAAMKGHLGFYPTPSGVMYAEKELIKHNLEYSKGCIRFSYTKPLPVSLIKKIIKFRVKEVMSKGR